jgi:hypothetical protein
MDFQIKRKAAYPTAFPQETYSIEVQLNLLVPSPIPAFLPHQPCSP